MQSSAQGPEDANSAPSVQITTPAGGSTVATDTVTTAGTAADNVGVTSLRVNGIPTTVNDDGSWSQQVSLIVFRDEDGKSRTTKDSLKIKG